MENNFLAMEKNCQQLKVIFYPFPKQKGDFRLGTKIFVWDKKCFVQNNFDFVQAEA